MNTSDSSYVRETTPYPWPYDGDLDPDRLALLVVSPTAGGPPVPTGVLENIAALVDAVTSVGGVVVHVTTAPPPRLADAQASPAVLTGTAHYTLQSQGIDAYYGSSLEHLLTNLRITKLVLAGSGLETCIHSTMRSANDRGSECLLVLDACAAHDESIRDQSRSMVEMSGGIFGAIGTTADTAAALFNAPLTRKAS